MSSATAAATAEGRNLELERARVHGFIYGVLWEPGRPGRELTWEDLDGALLDPDAVLWLHFNAANAHAREWLSQCPRLPEALRRFLLDRDDRKRLDLVAEGIIGVISDVHYGFDFDPDQIALLRLYLDALVNARHVKNVSGRKSDVLDCQWLQQLMSFGLLNGAFRPQGEICALRSVARQRAMLLSYQSRHVRHMQKALTQMNIQLAQVISDVVGETGQRIIRAILAGERNGQVLAKLKHFRIRATEEEIAKALQGNWREEHLFALKQAVSLYDAYATELAECDRQLESMLAALARHSREPGKAKRRARAKNAPGFDMRTYLFQLCGVDLTQIDGIDVTTAFKVLAEVGADLSRFKTAKHFASWLGLCPGTKISGGKVLSGASKRTANRAAQALKLAAASLRSSRSALGAYYRRLPARMDKPHAVTACAHKLARLSSS